MELPFLRYWRESRLQGYSDQVLCEECLAGDEDAWGALLARYQNLIYSIPLKFHFTEDEAAEIFQIVAMDLYAGLEKLRSREKLQSWLISVTRHRCLHFKEKRHVNTLSTEEMAAILEALPDLRYEAEDWMLDVQEENLLREAVAALPRRCKELIRWLFYSDPAPGYLEVAERLGVAKNSMGFIRDRCLQRLRERLEKQGFGRHSTKGSAASQQQRDKP